MHTVSTNSVQDVCFLTPPVLAGTRGVTVLDAFLHGRLVWLSHFASEQNSNEPPCLRLKRSESHLQLSSWMGIM